jgi:Tetratricopeptide repeat
MFTSRSRDLDRLGTIVEVPPLSPEEGLTLLLRGYDVRDRQHDMKDEGSNIITRLGGLPLAIDQAAAYIQYKKIPLNGLPKFLAEYEAHKEKILQYTPQNFWEYGTMQIHGKEEENQAISAFTTWEMSFQQLESDILQKENAAHFLTVSAFLDPSNIGEYLFRNHWEANAPQPEWMQLFDAADEEDSSEDTSEKGNQRDGFLESALSPDTHSHRNPGDGSSILPKQGRWDSERFWNLIYKSYQLSLVQSIGSREEHGDAKFSLHPLIRDWLQLREKSRRRRSLTHEAIDLVVTSIREYTNSLATADLKSMLLAHMDTCLSNNSRFSKAQRLLGQDISSCDTAAWFASFYRAQGLYGKAEKLELLIVETSKRVLGQGHPSTLTSMANLASTYWNQGRWAEAEELNVQVIKTRKRVLGQEHPDTLIDMGNLASTYRDQGRWAEAEELGVQVMETSKRMLGQEHPSTLTSMANLASTYMSQGRWAEAEELNAQVMKTRKRMLGQEHPDTLIDMGNLASTYRDQGRWPEAEELGVQVMKTCKRVLGQEHPATLTSMANLASTYMNQGRWMEAEELNVQALETRKRMLGQEHPSTLISMGNLASTYRERGRWTEAEELNVQVMETRKKVLGQEHPDTLASMANLALTYWDQGRWTEAEELDVQVMETRKRVLGQNHPSTLTSMVNLAYTWKSQGRDKEAIDLMKEAERLQRDVLGSGHPRSMGSAQTLYEWQIPL